MTPLPPTMQPSNGIEVMGTAEPNSIVTVTDSSGNILCTAPVDAVGNWSCTMNPNQ